jgi:hypothetical protein
MHNLKNYLSTDRQIFTWANIYQEQHTHQIS